MFLNTYFFSKTRIITNLIIPFVRKLNVIISYIKEMKASHCENPDVYYDSIRRIISKLSASKYAYWYKYLVACEALVSGQPVISVEIFEKLKSKVSLFSRYFLLNYSI